MRVEIAIVLGMLMILSSYPVIGAGLIVDEMGFLSLDRSQEIEDPKGKIPQIGCDLFVENKGQWRDDISFIGSTEFGFICFGPGYVEYLVEDGLYKGPEQDPQMNYERVKILYDGSNIAPPEGHGLLDSYSNYFIGNDEERWVSGARHFERISYGNIWEGIDIEFYFNDEGLKYDMILRPGSDPDQILMVVESGMEMVDNGRTIGFLMNKNISLYDGNLKTYYSSNGIYIKSDFRMRSENSFGFKLGPYDKTRTVVIDPLVYSSYIGGSNHEMCRDIELDDHENIIVIGETGSYDFFVGQDTYDTTYNGGDDLFIMKFDDTGSNLIFTTFLGSSSQDLWGNIEIDSNGDLIISGYSAGTDFPVTPSSYDNVSNGINDIILSKLSHDGRYLLASTYFGGYNDDRGFCLTLDDQDRPFITGYSYSTDLPTTTGVVQPTHGGGGQDSFISCFSSDLSQLVMSTFLGGSVRDYGLGILIDENGDIIVTGETESTDFPATDGAFEDDHNGYVDCFLTVLDPYMTSFRYSTFIGGSLYDRGIEIVTDQDRNLYIAGATESSEFPVTPGAYLKQQGPVGEGGDIFLLRFSMRNWTLDYSTVIGGYLGDFPESIELDERSQVYMTGSTSSNNFPITYNAPYRIHNGQNDIFVMVFNLTSNKILYSTFMGGLSNTGDQGFDLELTSDLDVWITGFTSDQQFNITSNAFDNLNTGGNDGVLVKFHIPDPPSAPYNLAYDLMEGAIQLEWSPPQFQGDEGLMGYHLYRGINGSKLSLYRQLVEETSFMDEGIENYNTYQYLVTAYSWIGESDPTGMVTVKDDTPPTIERDMTDATGFSGKEHEFKFKITDNVGVSRARIQIKYGDFNERFNLTNIEGTDQWTFSNYINKTFAGEIQYRLWIQDHSLIISESDWKKVEIIDRILPKAIEDRSDPFVIAGTLFTFRIKIEDNIGIDQASVEYWYWDGGKINVSMDFGGNGTFIKELLVGSRMGTISYRFYFSDITGNWNKSLSFSREITDEIPPWFGPDLSSDEATTGDRFTFQVNITDNVGILGVFVEYWIGTGDHFNKTLVGEIDPRCCCDLPSNSIGELKYFFSAQDVSGNWAKTKVRRRTITDNDPPFIDPNWVLDETTGTGDILSIDVPVRDNVKLYDIQGFYAFDDEEYEELSLYEDHTTLPFNISIPIDRLGILQIRFTGRDSSYNFFESSVYNITIVDNKKPIVQPLNNITIDEDEQFEVRVEALDNIGVSEIIWEGFPGNLSGQIFNGSISEPGKYQINILVKDEAGNIRSTSFTITVRDVKEQTSSSSLSTMIIAGGISILVIIIITILVVIILARRKKRAEPEPEDEQESEPEKEVYPDYHQSDLLNPVPLTEEQRSFLDYGSVTGSEEEPISPEVEAGSTEE